MTPTEQALTDDRTRAEIAKLDGETRLIRAQTAKLNAEIERSQSAAIAKLMAETEKLHAETDKISRERFWIPFTVSVGVIVAIVTVLPRLVEAWAS